MAIKKETTSKDVVINNIFELSTLQHDETLSFTFNKINIDSIHFKNINFNLLEGQLLRKLVFKKITFENCVLGNLHSIDFNKCEDIYVINQPVDSYFLSGINSIKNIYFEKNNISSMSIFTMRSYKTLSIKNNNVKGTLPTLGKTRFSELRLDEMDKYAISDLEYLKSKLENKEIGKVFFNDSEIDAHKIFYIERKIKIQKLITENA